MTSTVDPGLPELTFDGAVATITLRRPEQASRLTPDDWSGLRRSLLRSAGRRPSC